jgi:hypothetical protein
MLIATCGCRGGDDGWLHARRATTTTPPTPVSEAEEGGGSRAVAVADAVDPGPQAPLFDALPAWLRGLEASLGATPDREVATREIREALRRGTSWGPAAIRFMARC